MPENKPNPVTKLVKEGGETADATIDTAGKLASGTITNTGKVIRSGEHAVTGVAVDAVEGVGEVGGEVGGLAKKAATNIAATPHDIIKSAATGTPQK